MVRDDPNTTTTIFEFISRGPMFHFWGTPRCRTKRPFYTVGHRQNINIFISCAIKCCFDATSDAKLFLKIMVVVVFGPSLIW